MAYFTNLLTPDAYERFSKTDRKVVGFRERQRALAQDIQPGDILICYVLQTAKLVGILEVTSNVFKDYEPLFAASDDPYTVRFNVKSRVWLNLNNAVIDNSDIVWNNLSFTKSIAKSSLIWAGFRGSLRNLEPTDGQLLEWVLREKHAGVHESQMKIGVTNAKAYTNETESSDAAVSPREGSPEIESPTTVELSIETPTPPKAVNEIKYAADSHSHESDDGRTKTAYQAPYSAAPPITDENSENLVMGSKKEIRNTAVVDNSLGFAAVSRGSAPKNETRSNQATSPMNINIPANDSFRPNNEEEDGRNVIRIQALLARIGERMNFKIWIPMEVRSQVLQIWKPSGETLLDTLPLNLDYLTLRTVETIDLLWVRDRSIARAFEVEDSSSYHKGVMRMADLATMQSGLVQNTYVVGPEKLQSAILGQVSRPVFALSQNKSLADSCGFLSFEAVDELYTQKHLEYITDVVLDEYSMHVPSA